MIQLPNNLKHLLNKRPRIKLGKSFNTPTNSNLATSKQNSKIEQLVEKFAIPVALYGSLATLPQVYQVIWVKQTAGVSALTFSLFLSGNIFWFIYGHLHRDKPIMLSHLITGILNLIIVFGVMLN